MKKRTKISLRTKIYLTMVGLLTLTGALYAATPFFFNAFPFPPIHRGGHFPNNMYATAWCNHNFSDSTAWAIARWWRRFRMGMSPAIEKYLAFAPRQSVAAGFTPSDLFITEGQQSISPRSRRCHHAVCALCRRSGAPSRTTARLRSTKWAHLATK